MIELKLENIPEELKRTCRWVLWQLCDVAEHGKLRKSCKVPFDAKDGSPASHSEFNTWASFEVALAAHNSNLQLKHPPSTVSIHPTRGVGMVLGPPFFGKDFDVCIMDGGVFEPDVEAELKEHATYAELSQSGTGVHIIGHGKPPYKEGHRRDDREIYSCNRFFVMTGNVIGDHKEIRRFTDSEVAAMYAKVKAGRTSGSPILDARQGKPSLKKQEMMTRTDFPDLSPVVMSLLRLLMEEHLFDREKVKAEFEQSEIFKSTHWKEKFGRLEASELDKAAGFARENIAKRLAGRSDEEIPADVDLNAPDFVEEPGKRLLFPESCMYGKAGELARKTETDPGYSYLSVLVMAAGRGIEPHKQVRPTLYGANLGDVGWGKSLAMQRAGALFGFPTEASPCIERFPESYEPDGNSSLFLQLNLSSDRGLYKAFEGETKARPAIIAIDELRNLLAKSNIENACLFTVLCSLYNLDEAGYADKKTKETIRVRLSLLGCLKVADENEFPTVFTHATSSGFYDRMLFGLVGKRVVWRPWYPGVYKHVEFSTPVIPEWVFKSVEECFGSKGNRFAENALRVTYITSAINGDTEVGVECVIKAMKFMGWQERLRNVFKPAKGANEYQECVDTVVAAFRESPGRAANWSKVARKNRWDRKFPRSLSSVKRLLEDMGRLTKDKATGKHFLREEF